jgi:hypothetical protein
MKKVTTLSTLWMLYGLYRKTRRIMSDWQRAKTEWERIGGFNASTEDLLKFLEEFSVCLIEYATWTQTTIDDVLAKTVRDVVRDHRGILVRMINTLREGREVTVLQFTTMMGSIADGSSMASINVLSTLYLGLQHLQALKQDGTPKPDTDIPAPQRPVLNFVRKIFSKE